MIKTDNNTSASAAVQLKASDTSATVPVYLFSSMNKAKASAINNQQQLQETREGKVILSSFRGQSGRKMKGMRDAEDMEENTFSSRKFTICWFSLEFGRFK